MGVDIMAARQWIRKYTSRDIELLMRYCVQYGVRYVCEVVPRQGSAYTVSIDRSVDVVGAIHQVDKIYDSALPKSASLILQLKDGSYEEIYHTERNKTGISYEAVKQMKG